MISGAQRAKDDQIWRGIRQRRIQIRRTTLMGDEAEVAQRLGQERPHMRFFVDDASVRRNRSPPERNNVGRPRELMIVQHRITPLFLFRCCASAHAIAFASARCRTRGCWPVFNEWLRI